MGVQNLLCPSQFPSTALLEVDKGGGERPQTVCVWAGPSGHCWGHMDTGTPKYIHTC